jgi:hypothetical protein
LSRRSAVWRSGLARDYRQYFGSYILPESGNEKLAEIAPRQLLDFRTNLLKEIELSLNLPQYHRWQFPRDGRGIRGIENLIGHLHERGALRREPFPSMSPLGLISVFLINL